MVNMQVLFRFIKKIFTNWVLLLGILPKVYDYIGAYSKWEYELPTWIVKYFIILAVAYAIYKAYEDEYLYRKKLEKKLAGPTQYEVKVLLRPIDFEKEKFIAYINELKEKAEDKLQSLPEKLTISEYDKHAYALEQAISSFSKKDKSPQKYNEELWQYESELRAIVDDADKYEESLISRIKSYEEKFFFVEFFMTNTGSISDSDINIIIECKNNNKVFLKEKVLKNEMTFSGLLPALPKEPSQPKMTLPNTFMEQHSERDPYTQFIQNNLDIEPLNAFRKQIKVEDKHCTVIIRDLHVGDEIDIFNKELILMKEDHDLDFAITIKSKESTKVLTPIAGIEKIDTKRPLYGSEGKAT